MTSPARTASMATVALTLTSRALPLVILSVVCGAGALVLLVRDAARGARVLAVVAVASIVCSWAVAQWPYLLPESLTVSAAASPSGTLAAVLVAVGLAAVIVLPGFALLYVLDQRGLLPEEGVDDALDRPLDRGPPVPQLRPDREGRR
jgi:cytochrome bd ubiquinol oxidase subunit II